MPKDITAILVDYLSYHGILPTLLIAVPFITGVVYLFQSSKRVLGLITILTGLLYSCAFFGIVYRYISIRELGIFAAIAVVLGIFSWVKFHHFSAKKCMITLIVFMFVVAGLLVAAPLIEKEDVLTFIQAIKVTDWTYIIFYICLGIGLMPFILKILGVLGELAEDANAYREYSNQDGTNGATGNEQDVDTTAP